MKDDKRLNEVIRVRKRPNNFVMIDKGFLEDTNLSFKAKGILAYLLSKPDNWKVIASNLVNYSTDGKASVYAGLKELKESGYYEKRPIRDDIGQRIVRWESTVYEIPNSLLTDFQEIENQEIESQDIENRTLINNDFNNNDSNKNYGREDTRAPIGEYGEFRKVRLTTGEHTALVTAYGRDKATEYIDRLDRHIASTGKRYESHYATIKKWIAEDESKAQSRQSKPSRFANCAKHKRDYAELERMEQQLLTEGGITHDEDNKA